jgi:hypothetical protein
MDTVRAQVTVTAIVAKAPMPIRGEQRWHTLIEKLLTVDEERRHKQAEAHYVSSWDAPLFDSPFEKRRLKILSALFRCLSWCGMTPSVSGRHGRDVSVKVGDTRVSFTLDSAQAEKQIERERQGWSFEARHPKDRIRLSLTTWRYPRHETRSWQDTDKARLETQLREIAVEMIVSAEQAYRDGVVQLREWRIERKAALEEAERQRIAEEARRRRELQVQREQQRVDHLLGQAEALHKADRIRTYVAAVQRATGSAPDPMTAHELREWMCWALTQADRIDPVLSGAYKERPAEPQE